MFEISTNLVKVLRERTGAGVIQCKNALIEAKGNIEVAIENMRKSGKIKAAKKSANITTAGVIKSKIIADYAIILEVNCQTDFVTKDSNFKAFVDQALDISISKKVINLELLKKELEEERVALVNKIGENIHIRRINSLKGNELNSYQHGTRIGVLVSTIDADKELSKQIAMHIAASKPEFIRSEDIPSNVIEKEYKIQMDIAIQSSKTKEIAEKIVEGRMRKFMNEISLLSQIFVIDSNKTVNQVLKEKGAGIIDFIRFEIGEELDKKV